MEAGSFFSTFIVLFRESLEASLIIGIIFTVLARMNQKRYFVHITVSSLSAILISILAGFGLMTLTESVQGDVEKIIEGGISLAACGILTYMVFWMDRQSKRIKTEIESQLEIAFSRKEFFVIISLPFLAIFREGAETVLFLTAMYSRNPESLSFSGGTLGFFSAAALALVIFIGGKRIPLKPLFQSTGLFLLLIAAGLLAYGIHEFQEIGFIPEIYAPIWNINNILNEKQGVGALLKSIFGYNGNPSLIEVTSYIAYLVGIYLLLYRKKLNLVLADSGPNKPA